MKVQLEAVLSLIKHFLGANVIAAIENAAALAAMHGAWAPGQKTQFVEDAARAAAAATATPVDDILISFAIGYYNSHYAKPSGATAGTSSSPLTLVTPGGSN